MGKILWPEGHPFLTGMHPQTGDLVWGRNLVKNFSQKSEEQVKQLIEDFAMGLRGPSEEHRYLGPLHFNAAWIAVDSIDQWEQATESEEWLEELEEYLLYDQRPIMIFCTKRLAPLSGLPLPFYWDVEWEYCHGAYAIIPEGWNDKNAKLFSPRERYEAILPALEAV